MALLDPGTTAPTFSLSDQSGATHTLSAYAGRPVVLFFYPKDDTPGCTIEACGFQAALPELGQAGAAILGISILDTRSKAKFASKYGLTFPLLADADHVVCEAFGVWQEKRMYGRAYMGVARVTYLIDAAGVVAQRWDAVKVERHAAEVLAAVTALGAR